MSIFQFTDYRAYLKNHLQQLPKKGHGELTRIAKHLSVHTTLLSLIFQGSRDFSLEQAFDLADYLQLTELEREYFFQLVQFARAGNQRYRKFLKGKIDHTRTEANKIVHRFEHEKALTEAQKSVFYSSWVYSAIRLFTSTHPSGRRLEEMVERFELPRAKVVEVLDFLCAGGLVVEEKGKYKMSVQRTFLAQGSPHLLKHHSNWRIKAIQRSDRLNEEELMFTSPLSLSQSDFAKIRDQLAEALKNVSGIVKDSPAEEVACLNVDLFWVNK